MAEKPYLNPRLRNPAEEGADTKKKAPKAKSATDWIGGAAAIIGFLLAAATVTFLYLEWDTYCMFIGK